MRAVLLSILVVMGCSTGGSGTPGGTTGDYCAAKAARASRCESGTVDSADCQRELACYNAAFRPDVRDEILNCTVNRACGASDDPCIATPAQRFASDPEVSGYISACNSKRTACGGTFSDDHCSGLYGVVTNSLRAKMKACIEGACAEVRNCFDAAYTSVGCSD